MSLRMQRAIAGAIVASLLIAFGWLLFRVTNPKPGDYEVRLTLRDADGLHKASDVKIAGVRVGVVTALDVVRQKDGREVAHATLRLDDEAGPIGAGAKAQVRPVNLLGEKFLDLSPGDVAKPQPSRTSIPISRTSATVGLDDVLNALDSDTRTRVGILINETGVALTGRAGEFRDVLQQLPSGLEEARATLAEISAQDRSLRRLIRNADRVLDPFADQSDEVGGLLTEADRMLAVTASREAALRRSIASAPAALRQLRGTIAELGSTATALEPTAVQLQSAAPPLEATLRAIPGFAGAAHDALRTARSVAPTVTRLAVRATPTVRRLRPTLVRAEALLRDTRPTVNGLANDNGAKTLLYFLQTWARVVKSSDGLGHLFGAMVTVDHGLLGAVLDRLDQTPPAPKQKSSRAKTRRPVPDRVRRPAPAPRPHVAPKRPTPALPVLPSVLDEVPKAVEGLLGELGKVTDGPLGLGSGRGASAPTGNDTLGLLDYLLGR